MSTPEFRQQLVQKLGDESKRQLDAEYAESRDPYGRAWTPSKKPSGRTLIRTGVMRASAFLASVSAAGFRLAINVPYAVFHQYGTRSMPSRRLLPTTSGGLGVWRESLNRIAVDAVKGLINGRSD